MATKKDMRRAELSMPIFTPSSPKKDTQLTNSPVVPYTEGPQDKETNDFQGTISSTLPMAAVRLPRAKPQTATSCSLSSASFPIKPTNTYLFLLPQIFTRNKMIGWTAVIFAIQGWLGETPAQAANATTPSYLQVGMAAMSLGVVRIPPVKRRFVDCSYCKDVCVTLERESHR